MSRITTNTPITEHKTTYRPPRDEAEAQRRREYSRAYRKAHPDKVRAWNNAFYLRRAAKALEKAAQIAAVTGDGDAE